MLSVPRAGMGVGSPHGARRGCGRLSAAPEAGRHGDRVACDLHHSLFDKEGERDFSVACRDLLLEIERRHELAEHRGLADRLQAAAAGRDEGAFRDQIEHVAGAAGGAIPVLLVERLGVAIDEPTPKHIFRRRWQLPRLPAPWMRYSFPTRLAPVLRSRHGYPPMRCWSGGGDSSAAARTTQR